MHAEAAYLFRHVALRDVVYQLQLPSQRAALHALAHDLLSMIPGNLDAMAAELADHARHGSEHDPTLTAKESAWLDRAAAHAARQFDHTQEILLLQRALELPAGIAAPSLKIRLGSCLASRGRFDEARDVLQAAATQATALGDQELYAKAVFSLGRSALMSGDLDEARLRLQESLQLHLALGDYGAAAGAMNNVGLIEHECNNLDAALECFQGAIDAATRVGRNDRVATALGNRARVTHARKDFAGAEREYRAAMKAHIDCGDQFGESHARSNLGYLLTAMGRHEEAESELRAGVALHHALGNGAAEAMSLVNLADLRVSLSEPADAMRLLERAEERASDFNAGAVLTLARLSKVAVLAAMGELARAEAQLAMASAAVTESSPSWLWEALEAQKETLHRLGGNCP